MGGYLKNGGRLTKRNQVEPLATVACYKTFPYLSLFSFLLFSSSSPWSCQTHFLFLLVRFGSAGRRRREILFLASLCQLEVEVEVEGSGSEAGSPAIEQTFYLFPTTEVATADPGKASAALSLFPGRGSKQASEQARAISTPRAAPPSSFITSARLPSLPFHSGTKSLSVSFCNTSPHLGASARRLHPPPLTLNTDEPSFHDASIPPPNPISQPAFNVPEKTFVRVVLSVADG